VTLTYSPFDLTGATCPIQVSYRDVAYGTAIPHVVKRHTHPKVKTMPRPEPGTPTGISYLDLLEHQRAATDGATHCISYRDLQATTAPAAAQPQGHNDHDH
jgi:hypothetical protein